jgi:antitoxin HigA-1
MKTNDFSKEGYMQQKTIEHPGKILKEKFLDPLGITPYQLARSIGVHVRRVSEIIKGNRSITPDTAIRLSLYFNTPARWWLEMQGRFDCENVPRINELRKIVKPCPKLNEILVTPRGVHRLKVCKKRQKRAKTMVFSREIYDRLKAQVLANKPDSEPDTERKTEVVVYKDGSQALTGHKQ